MDQNVKKICLVLGSGGFIGSHLAKRLTEQGHYVVGVDLKYPEYEPKPDNFIIADLRDIEQCKRIFAVKYDEVYNLAADMGGAGYVFSGEHDADILNNSVQINLNIAKLCAETKTKVFFSSSACVYRDLDTTESNVNPDSDYGLEKLFSEHIYQAYARNYGLDIRIGRFHNIFGERGTYKGGKEKAPAAICRKVCEADNEIEVWGDGQQTRSFLYIDECLEAIERLMASDFKYPVNIGSDELVSINQLAQMIIDISGKDLKIKHIKGAEGVRGRNSDNRLILEKLGWEPTRPLEEGLIKTYQWINDQK